VNPSVNLFMLAVRRVIADYVRQRKRCRVEEVPLRLYNLVRHHMPGGMAEDDAYVSYLDTMTVISLLHRDRHDYKPYACAQCGAACKKQCQKCAAPHYCSRECQTVHWREVHKRECARLSMGRVGAAGPPADAAADAALDSIGSLWVSRSFCPSNHDEQTNARHDASTDSPVSINP
jgi:hypothetical protein